MNDVKQSWKCILTPGKKRMLKMNGQVKGGHKLFINSLYERADLTISKQD